MVAQIWVQTMSSQNVFPSRQAANSVQGDGPDAQLGWISRGTPEYRNAGAALFLLGFASFSLIYCVQPLLPEFARTFGTSPAESSLALSLTTGFLALSIMVSGAFSQALGRRGLMFASMAMAALLNALVGLVPSWHGLLIGRAIEGIVLGGVPAVAMAWLAEEVNPAHLGKAMGLYIGGTAFGAMMGRVGMGVLSEYTSWHTAMIVLGFLCLSAAMGFLALLPPSRHFVRQPGFDPRFHLAAWAAHLRNPRLLKVYALGFALTSIFSALFNYATFRLSEAPYSLGPSKTSLIFLAFALGIVSSSVAGSLADRFGRRPLLLTGFSIMLVGVAITLASSIVLISVGIALVATGFFIGHSVASSAVGAFAVTNKGHASSLYLLFYYLGASLTGSMAGWAWQYGGWPFVAALTGSFAVMGIVLALTLPRSTAAV